MNSLCDALLVAIGELPARLKIIFDGVREVTTRYQPSCAAVEIVFVNVNPQSTLLLGQARGAALSALVSTDLAVAEYTALQMKKAIVGHGLASKAQVQEMVKRLLALPGLPGKDAADALGLAISHAHAATSMAAMAKASPLARRQQAWDRLARDLDPQRADWVALAICVAVGVLGVWLEIRFGG